MQQAQKCMTRRQRNGQNMLSRNLGDYRVFPPFAPRPLYYIIIYYNILLLLLLLLLVVVVVVAFIIMHS